MSLAASGSPPSFSKELIEIPARSQAQRRFLNWKFGHKWVKKHHFDNKGKLPARKKRKRRKR